MSRIVSLLSTAWVLILFLSMLQAAPAAAESYGALQLGLTIPHALSGIDLDEAGSPPGTLTDLSLNKSFMYGGKLGHYFEGSTMPWFKDVFKGKSWLGVETEVFNSTPHIEQQDQTRTGLGRPTATGISTGATLRVLTWALNVIARYPGERWQPYLGIGLGVFFANLNDKSVNESQSSTSPGLNTQVGIRYILNKQVSLFGEWKFNYTRLNFSETAALFGMDATYKVHHLAVGLAYHF